MAESFQWKMKTPFFPSDHDHTAIADIGLVAIGTNAGSAINGLVSVGTDAGSADMTTAITNNGVFTIGESHKLSYLAYSPHENDLRMRLTEMDITISANEVFGGIKQRVNDMLQGHFPHALCDIIVDCL